MRKFKCKVCNYIHTDEEMPRICPVCLSAFDGLFVEVDTYGREIEPRQEDGGMKC